MKTWNAALEWMNAHEKWWDAMLWVTIGITFLALWMPDWFKVLWLLNVWSPIG